MRAQKSNFVAYSSLERISPVSRTANILDLIKKNKEEKKRDEINKIYAYLAFLGIALFFAIIIYL